MSGEPDAKPEGEAPKPEEPIVQPDALGLKDQPKKPEGENRAEGEVGEKEPEPEKPVEYADFKVPDGVEVDGEQMKWFKSFAGERKLSQDDAQALVDRHLGQVKQAYEAPIKAWVDTQKQWAKEFEADKEIGGDNAAATKATIAKALDRFGGPGLREALILTGAGNNPSIIKFVHRMAKELVEGGAGPHGGPSNRGKSAAERMYPNLSNGET